MTRLVKVICPPAAETLMRASFPHLVVVVDERLPSNEWKAVTANDDGTSDEWSLTLLKDSETCG